MSIEHKKIGTLKATGYQFENKAPTTYRLPPNPTGYSIQVGRWSGSGSWSLEVVGTTSREKLISDSGTGGGAIHIAGGDAAEGVDLIFKNSTHTYCTVAPGYRKIPPKV